MDKIFKPELLTDKSRLQEIYNLRVAAYEQSPFKDIINFELYPNGWNDFLDESSLHWIIEDEKIIVASARLSLITDFADIVNLGNEISENIIPNDRPFFYFSRLVILANYRGFHLSGQLDQVRIQELIKADLNFGIATVREDRVKALERQGFKKICEYKDNQNPISETLNLFIINNNKFQNDI